MDKQVKSEYIVPMLDKTLQILDYLRQHTGYSRIAEISNELDIPKGTVFRILYTLSLANFVTKDKEDRYSLGVAFINYGSTLKNEWDILTLTRPLMEEAAKEIGETINIGIATEKKDIIILDSIAGEDFFIARHLIPVTPMYCSSIGKIFLSQMGEEELEDYLENQEFVPKTISTITSKEGLLKELEEVREKNLAFDREEYTYGLTCVGSGVFVNDKLQVGISITGPTTRLEHKGMKRIEEKVQSLAKAIEEIPGLVNLLVF